MKTLVVVAALLTLCFGHVVLTDSNHFVEGDSRYVWTPDAEGPQAVDLEEPVDAELINTWNVNSNQYYLYTRRNPHNPQVINHGDFDGVFASNYNPRLNLNVIVHGWNQNDSSVVNTLLTSTLLARRDCNVIVVDWSALANSNYVTASDGVPIVGRYVGIYVLWLINITGGNWNLIHLVGTGLGAHVVGIAGRTFGSRPARITGLDPAGPGWRGNPDRLSPNFGQYVEGIHSDGEGLGIFLRSGDADFYINRGLHPQPGCMTHACSHNRAVDIFATSIRSVVYGIECLTQGEGSFANCTGDRFPVGNDDVNKRGSGIYLVSGTIFP